jgi:hypothetical protein
MSSKQRNGVVEARPAGFEPATPGLEGRCGLASVRPSRVSQRQRAAGDAMSGTPRDTESTLRPAAAEEFRKVDEARLRDELMAERLRVRLLTDAAQEVLLAAGTEQAAAAHARLEQVLVLLERLDHAASRKGRGIARESMVEVAE